jgi:DnaK suppressor protein
MSPLLPPDYRPSEDEPFMSPMQLEYFRQKLLRWRAELLQDSSETVQHMQAESLHQPDLTDRATLETDRSLELRTRDRERKLLKKISQSIGRIDAGDYGYCDETGEPIGLGRLLARPTATLSLEAQQRREMKQKMFGD